MLSKLSPFLALKVTNYRNYLMGSFVSEMGNQMQIVAVAWQVYEITRNPASLGLIGLANFIPILFFSLLGGLVADKVDRKKLLMLSLSIQSVLALILFTFSLSDQKSEWIIYVILFLVATVQSFSIPARQAVLPNLVPKSLYMNAFSLSTLQHQSALLMGPAIAGILIATTGVPAVYLFNALSFVIFIVTIFTIKLPFHSEKRIVSFSLISIAEGIRFVFKTPILYTTMALDFAATFFGTATILMPIFAQDVLRVGPTGLGLLYSAPAVGGVVAALLMSTIHRIKLQGRVIIISVILYGLATIGFGFSKYLPVSLAFLVMVGFGDMVSTIIRNTIRQMVTPDYLRGRMASVMRIFFQGGPQLGEIEAGFLAKVIGGPASVVIGGVGVILISSIIAFKSKDLRNYRGKELAV